MISFKNLLSIIPFFLMTFYLSAQKLDHVLGEVIVEVRSDQSARTLLADLNTSNNYRSTIQAKKLISEPMNLWVLKIDPSMDNEISFLENVKMNRNTLLAQKNHLSTLRETIPNDPLFSDQWQYINMGSNGGEIGADLDIDLAWDHTTGGTTIDGDEIVVCVIDDGIRSNHPDIGDNLWINTAEIADNGIDDDGNGYIDDVRGWNAEDENDILTVDGSHGTPVAGIIGAQGNNEVGVSGVNWDVKLMIVIGGSPESLALASYAYPYTMRKLYNETNGEKGAFVVSTNASWGIDNGQPEDAPIWCDFYNLLGEEGILNFGATANANTNVDTNGDLPTGCSSDFLVSVTNLNRQNEKVQAAGFGTRTIDLGAFGAQSYTLTATNYGSFGGTSAATPHVSGTAALLYATNCSEFMTVVKSDPELAALAVKDYILHGVVENQSLQGRTTTGGRLNVNNAILNLLSTCQDCTHAYGTRMEDITIDNARVTWLDNGKIGEVTLRYKELDAPNWIEIENISSGYQFTNLNPCTQYEYQIKTTCDASQTEEYTYARVFSTDGCCVAPAGITASLDGNSITVNWANVTATSNFILEYKNADDTLWNIANLDQNTSFSFPSDEGCSLYEIRIKSECEITSNESEFSETILISTDCQACGQDYCTFDNKNISDEWIAQVGITDLFNSITSFSPTGYEPLLGKFNIKLDQNETYELSLTPGYSSSQFDEFFSAYIDYNQDGEFSTDEVIFESTQPTQSQVTGIFTVPNEAQLGITRMRVIMRFNTSNESPCDNNDFEYGEIEDYCVDITTPLNTTDINETSITIYPTLTSDHLTVDFGQTSIKNGSIEIISIENGQKFKEIILTNNIASKSLDLSQLSSGIYMIVINTPDARLVQKVVKI